MCNYLSFGIDARIGYGKKLQNEIKNNNFNKDLIFIDQHHHLKINVFTVARDLKECAVIKLKLIML